MSAYTVSKTHIDVLIAAGLRIQCGPMTWYHGNPIHSTTLDYFNADIIGRMLWDENFASINYRYTESERPPRYEYSLIAAPLDPVMVLKQIACYEYQSCEHPGWNTSSAKAFCDSLTSQMINLLPGYAEAPWGVSDDEVIA